LNSIIKKTKDDYNAVLFEKNELLHERDKLQLNLNLLNDEKNKYKTKTDKIKKSLTFMQNNYNVS
jgi:hypothetical protein